MLDTYNQQIQNDVSCTIRTNINTANHHYIVKEIKIVKVGNYSPSGHNASSVVSIEGIAPAVMENHGTVTAIKIPQATKQGYIEVGVDGVFDWSYPTSTTRRGRVQEGGTISPTFTCNCEGIHRVENSKERDMAEKTFRIRKLTPRECFRLMGVDDKDIDTIQASGISNSQQYKMAGNSIVVDTLYHLMRKLFVETDCEEKQYQQTLF